MSLRLAELDRAIRQLLPGLLIAGLVAIAAQFVAEHYGAPAMLMALLFGMALNCLGSEPKTGPGITFASRGVLRIGVALLGARITASLLSDLGVTVLLLLIVSTVVTILFGVLLGRLLGQGRNFSVLTAGAVAICGVSAAMAIAAVQPRTERSERNLTFTVLGVTLLSTLAMILYPAIAAWLGLSDHQAGIFIGGTVHDVAQVIGAGFSVSPETGETATLVKLIRVSLLAPVVLTLSLVYRNSASGEGRGKVPILPGFVLGFAVLAAISALGLIPDSLRQLLGHLSGWALLVAIAGVGLRTKLDSMLEVGPKPIGLLFGQTVFLAAFILISCEVLAL
ncbi:MAG: YeiH family putative sulfate export transporter [Paracoccus denitrificans]|uniref:YeiH family putative sulfate export transporter n=1 Tax=Paracoccus denitrificans TaxID=266 RepID=A0A533I3D9_PARDE|nr:MAG: YeiH family putative sulfate export transporter [Paracoccus denitrificans]